MQGRSEKLAKEQSKLMKGKVDYHGVDTNNTSYDWAQNVYVPYSGQQVRFIIIISFR